MRRTVSSLLAVVALAILAVASGQSRAAGLETLVSFCALTNCADGANPSDRLIADANGNLFGTTEGGGANGHGTVFEIVKTASGYASTPTILVSFNGADGSFPRGGLILDAKGNLFGTTVAANGDGTVFEIRKTRYGYASTPTILVSVGSGAGVIADAKGNLFSTTGNGGANGHGTVFQIVKTASGYANTTTTLVSFNGADGSFPQSGLILDAKGNLFGTTQRGGAGANCTLFDGCGTAFEIAKTASGYASTPTTLVSFCTLPGCADGGITSTGLTLDANGNLFGTTPASGLGFGTVFEIVKTASGYASTATPLVSFCALANCADGANPSARVILDANGNLFGTTRDGGANGLGTVFEIAKTASGYASTPTTLVSFSGGDGANPAASVVADANGNLFGATLLGGTNDQGTVFEVTGSGFVVRPMFAGTPGKPNCFGQGVSALARQYGGRNNAAAALNYPSVEALQKAILEFCEG